MTRILSAPYLLAPGIEIRENQAVAYDEGGIKLVAPLENCLAAYPRADVGRSVRG